MHTEGFDTRGISIIALTQKLYMSILLIDGHVQLGKNAHHQAPEFAHILRIIIEKCAEWKIPLIAIATDIWKAFDSMFV